MDFSFFLAERPPAMNNDSGQKWFSSKLSKHHLWRHRWTQHTITQARGRYRDHLENLYLHSVDECGVVVPPQYLNRHLYKQDYDELRSAIGIMDPNDSKRLLPKNLLKQLLEANGYTIIENLRDRKGRYRTIEKREDM